jgi:hypothetical protein
MIYAFDTETALISAGLLAPPLTCLTWCEHPSERAHLLDHVEAVHWIRSALESGATLVGQNVAYDMGVMSAEDPTLLPLIFQAYAEDRVTDTMLRQQLADIADGKFRGYADAKGVWRKRDYSLAALSSRLLGQTLEKDEWRLRYGEFRGVPIETWPEGAREYPRRDAEATRDVYLAQEAQWGPAILADQFRQSRAAFALHLASAWGLHTDEAAVRALEAATVQARNAVVQTLLAAGLVRTNGSRDTKKAKAAMIAAMGEGHRKTATGDVCLDADACEASEDPLLEDYAAFSTLDKVLSNDIPALYKGTTTPIQTRYGLADTGRTTSSGPNIQNVRRLPGIRECFRPRPGYVYAQADYHAFELFALAQTCLDIFGSSTLAETLNDGWDPHTLVAGAIIGHGYNRTKELVKLKDPDADNARQTAKVANFGFPGGLGFKRLVDFAKKGYNVTITEVEARALKATWLEQYPEMRQFFAYVDTLKRNDSYTLQVKRSGRWRSGASYCAACNSHFQGLAADGAKAALFLVSRACYVEPTSPLFGSRIVAFVHDEIILESPVDKAPEAAEELSRLMVQGAKEHMPDMNIRAKPCLMSVWSKMASTLRDDTGRLVVWNP